MKPELQPLKDIVIEFDAQIKQKEAIWRANSDIAIASGFQDDHLDDPWPRKEALCWVFADRHHHFLKIDRSTPEVEAVSELAKQHYTDWLALNLEVQVYENRIIPPPEDDELLGTYLERISSKIHEKTLYKSSEKRSLRSFTAYLREIFPKGETGFIEEIFPEEMVIDSDSGKIARIVPPTVNPIDLCLTAKILQGLAMELLEGRPNTQLVAGETLGLAWISLACSYRRLPTQFDLISKIPSNYVTYDCEPDDKGRTILVPTLYGSSAIPTSSTLNQYLNVITTLGSTRRSLFQSEPRSLRRVFDKVVERLSLPANLGKITLLTFLSFPHVAVGQR